MAEPLPLLSFDESHEEGATFQFQGPPGSKGSLPRLGQPLVTSSVTLKTMPFSFVGFLQSSVTAGAVRTGSVFDFYYGGSVSVATMNLDMGVKVSLTDATAAANLYGGKTLRAKGELKYEHQPSGVSFRKAVMRSFSTDVGVTQGRLSYDIVTAVTLPKVTSGADLQVWNLSLTFSFAAPQPIASSTLRHQLVEFLHRRPYCDCSLLAKDAPGPLYVSRTVLSNPSPFFRTMFKGEWADSRQGTDTPIQFTTWHAPAVALALIHIYSDSLGYPVWRNLFELSQMLELKPLTLAVNRQLVKMLETQYLDLKNAEVVPKYLFSDESDDDEAELSGGEEEVTKGPDHVEQEAAAAAV